MDLGEVWLAATVKLRKTESGGATVHGFWMKQAVVTASCLMEASPDKCVNCSVLAHPSCNMRILGNGYRFFFWEAVKQQHFLKSND